MAMIEQEQQEIIEEEPTEEDILLYSSYPGPRIFVQNTDPSINIFGLLLEENDDSFLVGLPARIKETTEGLVVEPFVPVPYFRLMKSGILHVMYTFGVFDEKYMEYLMTKGREIYPEISEYIEEGDNQTEPAEAAVVKPEDTDVSLSKDYVAGGQLSGMTDDELKKYLTEKYNNGELTGGSRKKH